MSDQIFRLMERHQKLDDRLSLAKMRRLPDPIEITRLKKMKLAVRDSLSRLLRKR